ncbi:gliding motility-associated ABC transporter substrate-binding protein GldG [Xanthovirga aplysinae]|uniref:gliding motility-associated ABC transporter substrate-binding protein GldG n=1 Tax=Xanthovirga aplysinae TaxID=2529853 RepID=UPI0012BC9AC7|nr:gliding motility-associated ABC transporter substrate-binding protein GldG [Xanthovirga aplysinae]MTI33615.1 gliding motility-associated ABC transporter substrate-binding protein GldG [Xanthovirga aplysinae]
MVRKHSKKWEAFLRFTIALVGLVLINLLGNRYFFRLDLTEEKRYSITDATKDLLENLDDEVFVEVYLDGDLPSGFVRLKNVIRETLDEFQAYGKRNVRYEFIDPSLASGTKARNEFYKSLMDKGLQPTNLFDRENGKRTEKLVFPGAIISYGGKESVVMLLKGNQGAGPGERLNQSVEGVEYELASAIRKLSDTNRKKIALLQGHDELFGPDLAALTNALLEFYDVFEVNLSEKENLMGYDAFITAKPRKGFDEQDKFKLDQFIMNNGKAVFLLNSLRVNMDSAGNEGTYALPYDLNLDDQLFKYGVRINRDYIQDLNSGAFPIVTGNFGEEPQIRLWPWPFFPIMNKFGNHPVVKNLDAVYGKFVSSIDTVKAVGVKKTPLIFTSQYSRKLEMPVRVSFNDLRKDVFPENFQSGPFPIAYLLEGNFTSLYKNRFLPEGVKTEGFREEGSSKVLVVSDGDLVRNDVNPKTEEPYPLGYDPYLKANFANQDFILNAMSYILEDQGLITARAKEIKIRPLDKVKVGDEKVKWQLINLILPVFLLLIFGVVRHYLRKRQYGRYN